MPIHETIAVKMYVIIENEFVRKLNIHFFLFKDEMEKNIYCLMVCSQKLLSQWDFVGMELQIFSENTMKNGCSDVQFLCTITNRRSWILDTLSLLWCFRLNDYLFLRLVAIKIDDDFPIKIRVIHL